MEETPPTHSSYCTFCDRHLTEDITVPQHVGRHLEELAFIILAKQYQEWEFRDDDSASDNLSYSSKYVRNIEKAFQRGNVPALFQLQKRGYDTIPSKEVLKETWDGACSGTYPEKNAQALVWYLLRNGVQPPESFIRWAIQARNTDMVTMLLKADSQISSRYFSFAMEFAAYDIVEMFLVASKDAGHQLYMEDVVGSFIWHRDAAPETIQKLLQLLTTRRADLIDECADAWYKMLREKNYPLVNRFLELTQSPRPIHITRALDIIADRPVYPKDQSSEYPIFIPPQPGSNEDLIARALVIYASRIAGQPETNKTALSLFIEANVHLGVIHYLQHPGLDPNEPDAKGRYPLQEAILAHRFIPARLLFASGARIEIGGDEQVVFDYASSFTATDQTWADRVAEFREYCSGRIGQYSHRSRCSRCNDLPISWL